MEQATAAMDWEEPLAHDAPESHGNRLDATAPLRDDPVLSSRGSF
ncbi:unnamed protein product, partial [Iphiclides podalirius]